MPRAIWKGAISFGMVVIPIKLYIATKSKTIPFVTLHSSCQTRLRQRRWCEYHEEFVELEEVVRGYEYAKDEYLVMEDADFEELPVSSTHTIDIAQFVGLDDIDPIYYDKTYTLEPETIGEKPYYLLKKALDETNRVAIGRISVRQKEHVCCVRPYEQGLVVSTMLHADEIRATEDLNLPEEETEISKDELEMAMTLVDRLVGEFKPDEHQDEYRIALEQRIEAKLGAEEPVIAAAAPGRGKVVDLMDALRASIEATKEDDAEPAKQQRVSA